MLRFDRRLLHSFDWVLAGLVLVVALIALVNLNSASYLNSAAGVTILMKQFVYFLMGGVFIVALISFDYKRLIRFNYLLYGAGLLSLVVVLLLAGEVAGTQRWIDLKVFRLQPSEPFKLLLIITLASYYYRRDTGKGFSFTELIFPVFLCGVPFFLIFLQPDLGTALILGFVFVSMTLFVKLKWSALLTMLGIAAGSVSIIWMFFLQPYQQQRLLTFLSPGSDPFGSGYQITQSKIAVGSGSTFGKGYMQGTQAQLDFLPERHTDFAFSVLAEEWGFVGSIIFLAFYFFIVLWGLNTAMQARDKFGVLLAFGISMLLFWQASINIAMVVGLLPVVGMPLPLLSYGGSSLITTLAGVGLLMNIRMRRNLDKNKGEL